MFPGVDEYFEKYKQKHNEQNTTEWIQQSEIADVQSKADQKKTSRKRSGLQFCRKRRLTSRKKCL